MIDLDNLRYFKRPEDIFLFGYVFFSIIVLRILLSRIKIPRLLALLEPGKQRVTKRLKIEHVTKFSQFFLHRVFKSPNPCMLRSLLLYRYLKSGSVEVKIAFGVKNKEDMFQGHAWLIHKGTHFLETEDPLKEYHIVFVYP